MGTWQRWVDSQRQVKIAVVGAGFIGRGVVHRLVRTPGIWPALIVNRNIENALLAYKVGGRDPSEIVVSDDPDKLAEAIDSATPAVTSSPEAIQAVDGIDLVVEATGALDYGAAVILGSVEAGKHVVSMNAEVDATIGALLHSRAREAGVVYTISDGD